MYRTLQRRTHLALAAIALLAITAAAQVPLPNRIDLAHGETNEASKTATTDSTLVINDMTAGLTALQLAQAILSGPGVTISNVVYTGTSNAAGAFTSTDPTVIGFTSGIMLSSGSVQSAVGPNLLDYTSTDNAGGSDPDLQAIIPGYTVNDACVLEFDFTTTSLAAGQTGAVNFNFVFSSEEYNEWVFTAFNDVFGFFLNGQNIAKLQDLITPVEIDTVNGGNPYSATGGVNHAQYRNNDLDDGGGLIDTEMDGLTVVLTAHGTITGPGPHHIKLAIADAGDFVYDSNVFIQGASLVVGNLPTFVAPTPTQALNLTAGVPASWQLHAVANNGSANANVTMSATSVSFDAGYLGNPVATAAPFAYAPALPCTGQPAATTINWTPPTSAIGAWEFHYHLVDNQGLQSNYIVYVNVVPPVVSGPGVIAPSPDHEIETPIYSVVQWEVHAVSNSGFGGGACTIQSVEAEFDDHFLGNTVHVNMPFSHYPSLPVTGQPAVVTAYWVPDMSQVGQWDFTYHLVDNLGQTAEYSVQVNVENGALVLGVQPTFIPLGSFLNDGLRVEPILTLAISNSYVPEVVVPNDPNFIGLEIYAQAIVWDTTLYPTDPFKASATLKMKIGWSNSTYAPGSGLQLIATDPAQLDQPLPLDFTNPF